MKILAYIEDLTWMDIFEYYFRKLNGTKYIGITFSKEIAVEAAKNMDKVYLVEHTFNPKILMDSLKKILAGAEFDSALFPSTNKGRVAAGIYMGLTSATLATDVLDISPSDAYIDVDRLVFGGTALSTIRLKRPIALCVVKGDRREKPAARFGEIEKVSVETVGEVSFKAREVTGNDPTAADLVVVAGRGVRKREDMVMIEELAGLTGGAWSVTRPLAADYRWADHWIGISGLVVSPKVYISFGVSGQPHHLMGARASKYIVAVNKDPEAPIFEEADLGIVGDLYKVLPRLLERLKKG